MSTTSEKGEDAVRVFLVDDQELVRTGMAMVIGSQPDLEVVGLAVDGADALRQLAATPCDVVIMDVQMPRMDGIEATRRLVATAPDAPRVVVLTTFDHDEYAFAALRAGASGFLLKDAPAQDLLAAIRTVHAGDAVVAPSTTRRLIQSYVASVPDPGRAVGSATSTLTAREREVLVEIAHGLSNGEIAARLVVSEATVKTHVGHLLAKTGRRDRVALVMLAYDLGLVRPLA